MDNRYSVNELALRKRRVRSIALWTFVGMVIFFTLFPVGYILSMSFKTELQALSSEPVIFFIPTLANYQELFEENDFLQYFLNSVFIATVCVIFSIGLGAPFAYAMSRSKQRWVGPAMVFVMILRVIPPISILIPVFGVYTKFKMNDTFVGVIALYMTFSLPLAIWLLKGAFDGLPEGIEEAARIDGCSTWKTFLKVSVPIVMESVAAAAILIWVNAWNEYLYAMIVTRNNTKTITVVINSFMRFDKTEYGLIAAAAVIISAPVLILGVLARKYLVSGMTNGAVKE